MINPTYTWPANLPTPEATGYQPAPQAEFGRVNVSDGPGSYRAFRRSTVFLIPVMWRLTEAEMITFRDAWDDPTALNSGYAWFTITLRGSAAPATFLAHFFEHYQATLAGFDLWRVQATLEAIEQ